MNEILIYSVLLAIALVSNILCLAIITGVAMRPYSSLLNLKSALVFSIVHSLMAVLAFNIGVLISGFIPDFSVSAGHLFTAFVGVKFVLETKNIKSERREYIVEDTRILFGLSFASSFNTFLAFLGFGMILKEWFSWSPFVIIAGLVFVAVLLGTVIGNKIMPKNLGRYAKLFGGLLILLLSIFLLFQ
jgi:putative Mn2+ efflux pump MntP